LTQLVLPVIYGRTEKQLQKENEMATQADRDRAKKKARKVAAGTGPRFTSDFDEGCNVQQELDAAASNADCGDDFCKCTSVVEDEPDDTKGTWIAMWPKEVVLDPDAHDDFGDFDDPDVLHGLHEGPVMLVPTRWVGAETLYLQGTRRNVWAWVNALWVGFDQAVESDDALFVRAQVFDISRGDAKSLTAARRAEIIAMSRLQESAALPGLAKCVPAVLKQKKRGPAKVKKKK